MIGNPLLNCENLRYTPYYLTYEVKCLEEVENNEKNDINLSRLYASLRLPKNNAQKNCVIAFTKYQPLIIMPGAGDIARF